MAIAAQAALLDELMGKYRNELPNENRRNIPEWQEEEVCKFFLCGFCPNELFTNTKADLGPCQGNHDERLREMYKNCDKFEQMGYEKEFVRHLNNLITDVERRIRRGHARLNLNSTMANPNGMGNIEKEEHIDNLSKQISELVSEAERLGTEGSVQQAQEKLKLCEQLRTERNELDEEKDPNNTMSKELEVCDICGAFRIRDDAPQRIEEHLIGKMHIGYALIRDHIRDYEEKRSKRLEENRLEAEKHRDTRSRHSATPGNQLSMSAGLFLLEKSFDRSRQQSSTRDAEKRSSGRSRSRDRGLSRRSKEADRRLSRDKDDSKRRSSDKNDEYRQHHSSKDKDKTREHDRDNRRSTRDKDKKESSSVKDKYSSSRKEKSRDREGRSHRERSSDRKRSSRDRDRDRQRDKGHDRDRDRSNRDGNHKSNRDREKERSSHKDKKEDHKDRSSRDHHKNDRSGVKDDKSKGEDEQSLINKKEAVVTDDLKETKIVSDKETTDSQQSPPSTSNLSDTDKVPAVEDEPKVDKVDAEPDTRVECPKRICPDDDSEVPPKVLKVDSDE